MEEPGTGVLQIRQEHEATVSLLALFVMTSGVLVVGEGLLSRSAAMTLAALKVQIVVVLLCAAAGLVARLTRSTPLGVLVVSAYLAVALWAGSRWALAPLVVAAVVVSASVDWRQLLKRALSTQHWLAAVLAAALILPVVHLGDFLIMEKLRQAAVHQDALFHASISSMLKTYGEVSVGLNGLVALPYHVFSHRILAALSLLAGVPVLEVYGIAEIVVLCPLLLFAATWCTVRLSAERGAHPGGRAWLVVCAVLVLLHLLPLEMWAVWDSYFVSESYTLALAYFMLALPAITSRGATAREYAIAAALLVIAGLSKGSVGLIGLGLLWTRLLVLPPAGGRRLCAAVTLIATVAFVCFMLAAAESASHTASLSPFFSAQAYGVFGEHLRQAIESLQSGHLPALDIALKSLAAIATFLLANFILSWAVMARRLRISGFKGAWTHPDALLSLAAVAVGLVVLQVRMPGGWYFVNQAMFVSLPFAALVVQRRLEGVSPGVFRLITGAAVLAAAFAVVQGYRDQPMGAVFMKSERFVSRLNDRGRGGHVDALLSLRHYAGSGRVIFESDEMFPAPAPGIWDCFQVPFTYPAVTERAWVGILGNQACSFQNYGYAQYFPSTPHVLVPPVIPANTRIVPAAGADHSGQSQRPTR